MSKNFSILLLNIIAAVLAAGLAWFLWGEVVASREMKLELGRLEAEVSRWRENEKIFDSYPGGKEKVRAYFINPLNLPSFIERLEGLSRETGVSFDLTRAEVAGEGEASRPQFEFTAVGSFAGLERFLFLLEQMPHEVSWQNLRLNQEPGEKDKAGTWRLAASFELLSYHDNEEN